MWHAQAAHTRPFPSNLWTLTSHSGHEFPFSIKMSHIRDGGSSGGGLGVGRDPTSPTDCPGVLLLDQCLPPDTQCQFILKPNKVSPGQAQLIGKTKKPSDCFHEVTVMRHFPEEKKLYFKIKDGFVCGRPQIAAWALWTSKPRNSAVCSYLPSVEHLWWLLAQHSQDAIILFFGV